MIQKYPNYAIVFSFIGLWLSSHITKEYQVFVGFIFILSFGILHGANDIFIAKKLLTEKKSTSFSKLLLYYISVVVFGGLLFYLLPIFALLLFILFSGYHFGEQQLYYIKIDKMQPLTIIFQTLYGLLVLFMLFYFHAPEVQLIIFDIAGFSITNLNIAYSLIAILAGFLVLYLYICTKPFTSKKKLLLELFYLLVFGILFKVASLIWGFALYFIVWHSIPSLIEQIKFLYGDFSKTNCIKYMKTALLYWTVSLIGLAVFYYLFNDVKLFNSLFFSFLAAITFPHVFLILKMFGKNNTTKSIN
jgi:beta-carotene 15,15'-dioxygenase